MIGDAYGALLRRVLVPTWEGRIQKRPTFERLAWLERTQFRPREELQALQVAALRKLIKHAHQHVPYYRRKLDEAGVKPESIRDLSDLARIPLLPRADARAAAEERKSTAAPLPTIQKATSGTMGQPLVFGYEPDSEYWRQAVKWRAYSWAGYSVGKKSLHYWGAGAGAAPSRKMQIDRLLKRETYVNCTIRGEAEMRGAVDEIRRLRPDVMLCYTQAGADLARFINSEKLKDWGTIPVICGAERLYPVDREALEQAFGPAVFETYGCREVMLIGSECERHDGLHLSDENLIVEVLVDGKPAKAGETGEIAVTDLHNLAMPFIRYVNGDLGVAAGDEPCACGRSLGRIRAVEGRVTETLRDAEGGRVSGLVFNVMFASLLAVNVQKFQAVQHKDLSITLKLVSQKPLSDGDQSAIRATCAKYLKGVPVKTELVDDIPLTKAGKRQVVVVER